MTIIEAINAVDDRKTGNQFSQEEKIRWLSNIDSIIKRDIIDTHEGADECVFVPYDSDTDVDTPLLAYDEYADLYIYYLEAQIDRGNQEFTMYNNDMIMFNAVYEGYASAYNRTHLPLQKNRIGV